MMLLRHHRRVVEAPDGRPYEENVLQYSDDGGATWRDCWDNDGDWCDEDMCAEVAKAYNEWRAVKELLHGGVVK